MEHSLVRRAAFAAFCLAAMAAGAPAARAASESVLYSFKGSPGDGAVPGALLYSGGMFYGTTLTGGSEVSCNVNGGVGGCGTAFSLTPGGTETVLHSWRPWQNFRAAGAEGDRGGTGFFGAGAQENFVAVLEGVARGVTLLGTMFRLTP
jgi:hypothetical protein